MTGGVSHQETTSSKSSTLNLSDEEIELRSNLVRDITIALERFSRAERWIESHDENDEKFERALAQLYLIVKLLGEMDEQAMRYGFMVGDEL